MKKDKVVELPKPKLQFVIDILSNPLVLLILMYIIGVMSGSYSCRLN